MFSLINHSIFVWNRITLVGLIVYFLLINSKKICQLIKIFYGLCSLHYCPFHVIRNPKRLREKLSKAIFSTLRYSKGWCSLIHFRNAAWKKQDVLPDWIQQQNGSSLHTDDSGFLDLDTSRFARMEKWRDSELIELSRKYNSFYPFGGPDFSMRTFYPNAVIYSDRTWAVGILPDLCDMPVEQINRYLEDVRFSLKDIFKRSYFITGNMIGRPEKKQSVTELFPLFLCLSRETDIISSQ